MWRMMLAAATLALCAGTVSCAGHANGTPGDDEGQSLEGVIVAVEPGPETVRLTVDLASGTTAEAQRVVLLASSDTEVVVQRADGTTVRGGATDLVVGARIRAHPTGVELRSLPPQYPVSRIRVLAGP